jgi:hypothetical protein
MERMEGWKDAMRSTERRGVASILKDFHCLHHARARWRMTHTTRTKFIFCP